jgi:hypothetical protein
LIADATVDCYNDSEAITGFLTKLQDNLALPFETEVLGMAVTVAKIDLNESEEIVAICSRGKSRQAIGVLDLPLPAKLPEGAKWIQAYRHWRR